MPELKFHDPAILNATPQKDSIVERQFREAADSEVFNAYAVVLLTSKQTEAFNDFKQQASLALKWDGVDREVRKKVLTSAASMAAGDSLFEGIYSQVMRACEEAGIKLKEYGLNGGHVDIGASKGNLIRLAESSFFTSVVVFGPKDDDGRRNRTKAPSPNPLVPNNLELV